MRRKAPGSGRDGVLAILPPGAVGVEMWDDGSGADPAETLIGAEREAVADAAAGRRREFAQGRICARAALEKLGFGMVAIPAGPDGAPQWPAGAVGSLTHKGDYRAAAVARSADLLGLGLDAELAEALPEGILQRIALPDELQALPRLARARPDVAWDRLLFSAKEAVYKALPAPRRAGVSFHDVLVQFCAEDDRVTARVAGRPGRVSVKGRWAAHDGLLLVATAMGGSCP